MKEEDVIISWARLGDGYWHKFAYTGKRGAMMFGSDCESLIEKGKAFECKTRNPIDNLCPKCNNKE